MHSREMADLEVESWANSMEPVIVTLAVSVEILSPPSKVFALVSDAQAKARL